jgi:hypothetical protein
VAIKKRKFNLKFNKPVFFIERTAKFIPGGRQDACGPIMKIIPYTLGPQASSLPPVEIQWQYKKESLS